MISLETLFRLKENNTTIATEIAAGFTTFLTMSYIIFVNPQVLSETGMNLGAVFVATCIVSFLGSFLVGIMANYPIAIAPGMALSVYFSYVVLESQRFSWESTLGNVFISGIIFLILTISKIRHWILESIPKNLNIGICIGIGFFIALLSLKNAGIITIHSYTVTRSQNLASLPTLLFIIGFVTIIFLERRKIFGSIVISIIFITLIGILLGTSQFQGIFSFPPSIKPTLLQLNLTEAFHMRGLFNILAFLLVALFDGTGTFIGLLQQKEFKRAKENEKNISSALIADSIATISGSLLGTSSTSPFIESASGIREGGRTGLTAVTVSILFLLFLFLFPLAKTIPSYAVAPALLYVGILMIKNVKYLKIRDLSEAIPSILTAIMIPITFSIADGLGLGIICYVLIKLCYGKYKDINMFTFILFLIFLLYWLLLKYS